MPSTEHVAAVKETVIRIFLCSILIRSGTEGTKQTQSQSAARHQKPIPGFLSGQSSTHKSTRVVLSGPQPALREETLSTCSPPEEAAYMTRPFGTALAILGTLFSAYHSAHAANPPKVVFIGDYMTANWPFPAGANRVNLGV
jgi:hypothetical protein